MFTSYGPPPNAWARRLPTSPVDRRMADRGKLEVAVGFSTTTGPRSDNQDFGGVDMGSPSERALQGVVAAVADGVGGAKGGRVAAELAVRSFIQGYRTQNPLAGVAAAVMKVM